MVSPSMLIVPASGSTKPAMARSNVVLPLPLGPSRAKSSPSSIRSVTSSSAGVSPKRLVTPWISTTLIVRARSSARRPHRAPPSVDSPPKRYSRAKRSTIPIEIAMMIDEIALTSGVKPLRMAE